MTRRRMTLALALCLWLLAATGLASPAKTYGLTMERIRVRKGASTDAAILDNLREDSCVYILQSKQSGSTTFVELQYRTLEGKLATGWSAQQSGGETYIRILPAEEAQAQFGVSGGKLPSAPAGLKTSREREALAAGEEKAAPKQTEPKKEESKTDDAAVREAQEALRVLSYYAGEITGNAGNKTVAALKAFQKAKGLSQTGKADSATLAALRKALKGEAEPKVDDASVREAQEALRALSYYTGEITGNAGNKTVAALKAFQKAEGLPQTGKADSATLAALRKALKGEAEPKTDDAAIREAQEALRALSYYAGEITGNAGNKTVAALKAFQKAKGLSQTGEADSATLAALRKAVKGEGTSTNAFTVGSTGDSVKALQENLTTLELYTGEVTGHYGEKTAAAVRKFQRKNALSETGRADKATRDLASTLAKKAKQEQASNGGTGTGTIYNLDWFTAKKKGLFSKIGFASGKTADLKDLGTGKTLRVRVQSSGNHLDVEPVAQRDTQALCAIYGVSDPAKISYQRRPMLLTTAYGYRILCSCYGTPHGLDKVKGNAFEGQFCLHFLNARTSGSNVVDHGHQAAIRRAASIVGNDRVRVLDDPTDLK